MRVGIVDLGTNSVRFDIHEIQSPEKLVCLYRMKQMVRLGEDVFIQRKIQSRAAERTIKALAEFKEISENYGVTEILASGTSALREAKNSKDFIQKVKEDLQIDIRVIDGKEEARLIMKAIHAFEPAAGSSFAFIDIGGGSTEIGFCLKSEVQFMESLQIGAARIRQMFKSYPPNAADLEAAYQFIRAELERVRSFKDWPKLPHLLGSSGTIKALVRMSRVADEGKDLSRKFLQNLIGRMKGMSQEGLKQIPGMEERRTDIILSGAIVLDELMNYFDAKEISRTKFALREGILQEFLEKQNMASSKLTVKL